MAEIKIATLGSHSALQILKGAKEEGFETIVVCRKHQVKPYKMFGVADKIIEINNFSDFWKTEKQLIDENAVLVPHGTLAAYTDVDEIKKSKLMYFGSKDILKWEVSRTKQQHWLKKAGLRQPKIFKRPEDIDRSVIVKFYGAEGGKGYFLANSKEDFDKKIQAHKGKRYILQEYIIGVPVYNHYFQSPMLDRLELMGFDKRYESNVDSLGRISARDQIALKSVDPSYVITGNIPLVVRESFLSEAIDIGENIVKSSQKLAKRGMFGPFCAETIITPEKEIFTFEVSARIVAGTNPYIPTSPYSYMLWDEQMSTGKRIAREIKLAIENNELNKVLG
ncbi:formate--phosphoribosylaminoimidazolecarboxamide ligase [Candidatus Woesearchaeota archaeon]|nr:formate--phosphoribosylaminoimidazolecarboxamide ligase [Candidatus Woesearchaeota archaeon]